MLSETHGGRSSEALALPAGVSLLERHGSPVLAELQPATKKGRRDFRNLDENMENERCSEDGFDTHMEGSEGDRQTGVQSLDPIQSEQEHVSQKSSFRDALIGAKVDWC
ncbi:hypothetical protein V6N11_039444 [Hibiscus sabdariffa]|uniref:Uncharacterized protein n=1 Tax=Hibiscus sabdariffa TaxID=183260 RepID=A0ABR2SNA4_9ROSI